MKPTCPKCGSIKLTLVMKNTTRCECGHAGPNKTFNTEKQMLQRPWTDYQDDSNTYHHESRKLNRKPNMDGE